jgi:hypothetical protein
MKSKSIKKVFLSVVIMACYLSHINAQVHFGIKGGINFENFNYKDAKKELTIDQSIGWQAGILLQFKAPVVGIGVQPELLYTVLHAKVSDATANDVSNSINYLEVPLNLMWSFNLAIMRPFIMAGPYFSYAIHIDGDELKDRIDRFDWGVGIGGGIEIRKIQFGARYTWGLQDVSSVKDFEMKNNTFRLSLAILF